MESDSLSNYRVHHLGNYNILFLEDIIFVEFALILPTKKVKIKKLGKFKDKFII